MARGPKKHLKRLNAPRHWMLDKLTGTFVWIKQKSEIRIRISGNFRIRPMPGISTVLYASYIVDGYSEGKIRSLGRSLYRESNAPRPSTGPHKLRECLPLVLFLRNRLKYALNGDEARKIVKQRLIKVDGKVRTDVTYPTGFMDVITIDRTNEHFRLIYDVKGRYTIHRISKDEAAYKLCKVRKVQVGPKGIPFLNTHDGRTIRYPDPIIKVNDTVVVDIATGKIKDHIKFDSGNLCMTTGGHNLGRVGIVTHRERHPGSFDIVHVKDAAGQVFATRLNNIFIIGRGTSAFVSLPRGNGVRLSVAEERDKRISAKKEA